LWVYEQGSNENVQLFYSNIHIDVQPWKQMKSWDQSVISTSDGSILKNIWQAKCEKYKRQEDNGYYLVQHYLIAHNQENVDQVLLLVNDISMEATWSSQ
jgi:phosphoglycerate-specific signal transduction histidine kinase